MTDVIASARERRARIQAHAESIGINDAYISTLVDTFYGHVRTHSELGPIFDRAIGDRWDAHLARMKAFWASVAMNAGVYSGKPVPAHTKLRGVEPEHFETWLTLFHKTLEDTAPSHDAIGYFMERASRIAESLKLAMFGIPGLPMRNT